MPQDLNHTRDSPNLAIIVFCKSTQFFFWERAGLLSKVGVGGGVSKFHGEGPSSSKTGGRRVVHGWQTKMLIYHWAKHRILAKTSLASLLACVPATSVGETMLLALRIFSVE